MCVNLKLHSPHDVREVSAHGCRHYRIPDAAAAENAVACNTCRAILFATQCLQRDRRDVHVCCINHGMNLIKTNIVCMISSMTALAGALLHVLSTTHSRAPLFPAHSRMKSHMKDLAVDRSPEKCVMAANLYHACCYPHPPEPHDCSGAPLESYPSCYWYRNLLLCCRLPQQSRHLLTLLLGAQMSAQLQAPRKPIWNTHIGIEVKPCCCLTAWAPMDKEFDTCDT